MPTYYVFKSHGKYEELLLELSRAPSEPAIEFADKREAHSNTKYMHWCQEGTDLSSIVMRDFFNLWSSGFRLHYFYNPI